MRCARQGVPRGPGTGITPLLVVVLALPGAAGLSAQAQRLDRPPMPPDIQGVGQLKKLESLSARAEREAERLLAEASARVNAAVPMEDGDAKRSVLLAAETVADSALAMQPTVESLYWRALARGLRATMEDGRDQVALAAAVHDEAKAILDVQPGHAGAHHLLGRLHGAVMRLGSWRRFVALRLLGGGALGDATWASAEAHFRAALAEEPEGVEHALELATVLVDTGRPDEARPLLEDVLEAPGCSAVVAHFQQKARALLEALDR